MREGPTVRTRTRYLAWGKEGFFHPGAHWAVVLVWTLSVAGLSAAEGEGPIQPIRAGDVYKVGFKSSLKGNLPISTAPGKAPTNLDLEGVGSVVYIEQALDADERGRIDRVIRRYEGVDYQRSVAGKSEPVGLRDEVRRIVVDRRDPRELAYCPTGPLRGQEIDLLRTHLWTPALEGLFPKDPFAEGASWDAGDAAVKELLGLETIESGPLRCSYRGIIEHKGKKIGQVAFEGVVTGTSDEGRSRDQVRGGVYFDPASRRLASLRAVGTREILSAENKTVGKLDVDFQLIVTPLEGDSELALAAKSLPRDVPEGATDVIFENPLLGVGMLQPRSWGVLEMGDRRVLFGQSGSTLVLHREVDEKSPTGRQYLDEVLAQLRRDKVEPTRISAIDEEKTADGRRTHFQVEASLGKSPTLLDYWVVTEGARGVSLAGRLTGDLRTKMAKEIERMARSIHFLPPPAPASK